MTISHTYDYIICGAGCAGLSLAVHIINNRALQQKRILIVDQDAKNKNDRTWCFWEKEVGLFQSIVHKEWQQLDFHSSSLSKSLAIAPYSYKLIRGIDFYNHCLDQLRAFDSVHIIQGRVDNIISNESFTGIVVNGKSIQSQFIFNSILFEKPLVTSKLSWLLQHFKGWVIRTEKPVFNSQVGTFMDFRTSQQEGSTFFYVLPFTANRALVEYTLFSHQVLEPERYDAELEHYIANQLNISAYDIEEREFGIIPMTNYHFPLRQHNIVNIGTAGGQTKSSSGYTFQFIQKHSGAIVQSLVHYNDPFHIKKENRRFQFYDSVLLHILDKRSLNGADIFTRLFKKNKASDVFTFLDNETSIIDDLSIISTLPTLPFTKAAFQQIAF